VFLIIDETSPGQHPLGDAVETFTSREAAFAVTRRVPASFRKEL